MWGVYFKTTKVSDQKADISVETTITNGLQEGTQVKISNEIIDPASGKVVAKASKNVTIGANSKETAKQNLSLSSPKRWSLEHPDLYTVKTTVTQKGKVIDQNEQQLGIRELTFDPDRGFALNGIPTKLKVSAFIMMPVAWAQPFPAKSGREDC